MPLERPQKLTESDHMSPHPDSPGGIRARVTALEAQVSVLCQKVEELNRLCSQTPPESASQA